MLPLSVFLPCFFRVLPCPSVSFRGLPWLLRRLPTSDRLHFCQQVAELAVVDFDAIVEVEGDALVGAVAELLVEKL